MRKKLLRFLRIAPLALLFATAALAQTTSTIIGVVTDASTGKPVEGAVVIATGPNLQGEQSAVTGRDGSFRITLLPPGQYKLAVQVAGFRPGERSDIRLGLDKTLRANVAVVPEAVTLEEQVVRTGTQAPVINVGSAESGAVITKEFVAAIPVGRSFEAVAVTVPGAQADALGIGFSGAQSVDNAYILDGLNVADVVYAGNAANLLTNFTEEIDVKTGSFMAEYGRATGGVVNVVTKSGSNEFHGSVFSTLRPDWLIAPSGNAVGTAGYSVWFREKPSKGSSYSDLGFEIGGPIKKDKLWFYAGFAPQYTTTYYERFIRGVAGNSATGARTTVGGNYIYTDAPNSEKKYKASSDTYQFTGKLTYLINENNTLSGAIYGNVGSDNTLNSATGSESRRMYAQENSTFDATVRYAGKFLNKKLIIEGVAGFHHQYLKDKPKDVTFPDENGDPITVSQSGAPRIDFVTFDYPWRLATFEQAPSLCSAPGQICYASGYRIGGIGYVNDGETANRFAGRLSAAYLASAAGAHNIKAGVDIERNYFDQKKYHSGVPGGEGGIYQLYDGYGFYAAREFGSVDGGASATGTDPSIIHYARIHAKTITQSNAFYAQDSWQILDTGLTLNLGLRWETQTMQDNSASDTPKLSINDNIAPRLAIIYDPTRTGRSKISANWGRFYEMIPLDMAARAFGSERLVQTVYGAVINDPTAPGGFPDPTAPYGGVYTGMPICNGVVFKPGARPINPRTCGINPTGGLDFGMVGIDNQPANISQIGGVSPVAPDLKGMASDQFGGSIEYEVLSDLSVGIVYEGRRLVRTIEDMSSNDGASYFIGNPGESKPWDYTFSGYNVTQTLNPRGVTTSDPFTGRSYFVPFPKPKREYDGITFKAQKNFSRGWQAQASYTYSSNRGNYDGLYNTSNGQLDPNITSQYDLPNLMPNRQGPLSWDRPHTVKLYGSYTWNPTQRLALTGGGGYTGLSGVPVNYLGAHPTYGANESYVLPRGVGGRTPFLNKFDLRANVEYVIKVPYAVRFTADLFNVLNDQTAANYDNTWTSSSVNPIVNGQCKAKNAAGKADPIASALGDCPDLAYLRTRDGRLPVINPNWGRPAVATNAFQAARSLRLGLALTF
jgi:hypothetical protein